MLVFLLSSVWSLRSVFCVVGLRFQCLFVKCFYPLCFQCLVFLVVLCAVSVLYLCAVSVLYLCVFCTINKNFLSLSIKKKKSESSFMFINYSWLDR
jgi:hypothetical protein